VRGTKFTVATGDDATRLRVAEGQVRVTRVRDGAELEVPAGHHASIAKEGALVAHASRTGEVLVISSRQNSRQSWLPFNQSVKERLLGEHLQRLAFRATVKDQTELQPEDLSGRPLIILSVAHFDPEQLRRIGLTDTRVPILCLEGAAYP